MLSEKWIGLQNKRVFIFFVAIVLLFVVFQYRFNYFTDFNCVNNDKFVKRVVEQVDYDPQEILLNTYLQTNKSKMKYNQVNEANKNTVHRVFLRNKKLVKCEAEKYVLFLKTHKTGSSTLTNILNRYADRHNFTVLLPKGAQYYSFDWPNKFRLSSSVNSFDRPNFLANHARYSRKSMNALFPRHSTTYISILRNPVYQWESTFQYMSLPYMLNIGQKDDPLDFFLNNLPSKEAISSIARRYPSLYLIRNPLFFDLGLDHKHFDNVTFIKRALKTLDDDFDLVLLMEHFDESLTLLRRRLCWDIDDVVHFKMNERLQKNKVRELSRGQIKLIKDWNSADVVLYDFFLQKFWQEVRKEGPGFYDDVAKLKKRRLYYSNICIEKEAIEEAYSSVYVRGYKMRTNLTGDTKEKCERMLTNELHYLDYFRDQHAKWVNKLEGVDIENFESSTEEADIFMKSPALKISSHQYGRPVRQTTSKHSRVKMKSLNKNEEIVNNKENQDTHSELSDSFQNLYSNVSSNVNAEQGVDSSLHTIPSSNFVNRKFDGKTIF